MEGVSTMVAAKISSAEAKLIDAIKDYLSEKGEDINRDGLIDTPERFTVTYIVVRMVLARLL